MKTGTVLTYCIQEEAERLRQREIELDALQAELQLNKEECDEDIGYYGRSFMYCIRDIEKEFKRTEPPVPLDVLKNNHGIDIHSMPKNADNKKRTDFNPPWHNKGGSMQGNRQKVAISINSFLIDTQSEYQHGF